MKRTLIALFMLLILSSCKDTQYKRYVIVSKHYEAAGMCHSQHETRYQSVIFIAPRVAATPPHHHSMQSAKFTIHIANDQEICSVSVDSLTYEAYRVLDVVKYKTGSIVFVAHHDKVI